MGEERNIVLKKRLHRSFSRVLLPIVASAIVLTACSSGGDEAADGDTAAYLAAAEKWIDSEFQPSAISRDGY